MLSSKLACTDGQTYTGHRDPPGQASVYISPGDDRKETYILDTFRQFPTNCPVAPESFAKAGFYYTGFRDRVKCFSCGLAVEDWIVGDVPSDQIWHKSDCDFAHGRDTTNQPIPGIMRFLKPPSPQRQPGEYVLRVRGPVFVENIVEQYPNLRRPTPTVVRPTPQPQNPPEARPISPPLSGPQVAPPRNPSPPSGIQCFQVRDKPRTRRHDMMNMLLLYAYLLLLFVTPTTSNQLHSGFEGKRCAPMKLYMIVNNQLECEDCKNGEYWSNRYKSCKPCTSHYYTNLKRNIRRSCKDFRPVSTTPHADLKLTESLLSSVLTPPKDTSPPEVLHDEFTSTEKTASGAADADNYFSETSRGTRVKTIQQEADKFTDRVPEGIFLIGFAVLVVVFVMVISALLVLYKYVPCKNK